MKAITVRKDGKLLCFGPDNGMYDPGVPDGAIKGIEDDYDVVQTEFVTNLPPIPTKDELSVLNVDEILSRIETTPALLTKLKALAAK